MIDWGILIMIISGDDNVAKLTAHVVLCNPI